MPELPEVETVARTLAPQIMGKRITAITVLHEKSMQAGSVTPSLLAGAHITGVRRRAKLLLLDILPDQSAHPGAEPLVLAFHLKMTGSFFVHPKGSEALKHTRIIFDLSCGQRLFFDDMRTFGYCRVLLPHELAAWPFYAALGPEPLDCAPKTLARHLQSAFANKKCAVKAALLDQSVIAGVGNIYADECLFAAKIRPNATASAISSQKLLTLATVLQEILQRSIKECGSSIRNYRDANGNAGAFQNSFAVYGRKGETCNDCGTALTACKVAGRGTVYCPHCQK